MLTQLEKLKTPLLISLNGAAAKILGISKTSLEIEFDTALDDDSVYYYEIHLLDKATGNQLVRTMLLRIRTFIVLQSLKT